MVCWPQSLSFGQTRDDIQASVVFQVQAQKSSKTRESNTCPTSGTDTMTNEPLPWCQPISRDHHPERRHLERLMNILLTSSPETFPKTSSFREGVKTLRMEDQRSLFLCLEHTCFFPHPLFSPAHSPWSTPAPFPLLLSSRCLSLFSVS